MECGFTLCVDCFRQAPVASSEIRDPDLGDIDMADDGEPASLGRDKTYDREAETWNW